MSDHRSAVDDAPPLAVTAIRDQFAALADGWAALDGAAGTAVPAAVVAAVSDALRDSMANQGGAFAGSERSTAVVGAARAALADLVGGEAGGVVLGPNMTTLTFHLAQTLADGWSAGDEVVVSSLDHDANVRPWVIHAQRAGATVRRAEFDPESGELEPAAVAAVLSDRTRLVAVTAASNAVGTRPDVRAIADLAHAVGALTYVDGVHATSHGLPDMARLGADFYSCSSYKFFGPHTGAVVADPELLATLAPAKLAPAPDAVPWRFERGTPAFELLAGVTAAIDWIAGLAETPSPPTPPAPRRARLAAAYAMLEAHTQRLLDRALAGLATIDGVRLLGHPARRTSTLSFVVDGHSPQSVARALAERRIAVWAGDNYAYELMRRYGLGGSGGAVRASIVGYNCDEDVDRLLEAVAAVAMA
jgi:cysteine desulfurase family protein (TIGR01976 family)